MCAQKKKKYKKGQTSVEYILIVGLLVGIVVLFGNQFRERLGDVVGNLFGQIGSGINKVSEH
jgi:Flp pilus assembly pilin Flp